MSFVSTYYNNLVTRLQALLPEADQWTRLHQVYHPEMNSELFLRKGWGLAIGRAVNRQAINCKQIVDRTIHVVISRECMFTDHDATGIAEVEKQLLEDLNTVMIDFEKNQTLNDGAGFAGYQGDGGIQTIRDEVGKPAFMYIEAEFTVKLIQAL